MATQTIIEALNSMTETGYVLERNMSGKIVIGDWATGESQTFPAPRDVETYNALDSFMSREDVVEKRFSEGMGYGTAAAYNARKERMERETAERVAAAIAAL